MATTTTITTSSSHRKPPKPNNVKQLVCFSFTAYAKTLIHHLKSSSDVPVEQGLSDPELTSIEATFNFTFPPDLRAILQEGLPVGPGFPNWRSSSPQQLHLLLKLPILSLLKQLSNGTLSCHSCGLHNIDAAKLLLNKAPVLVPLYRNCYIASTTPKMPGNPVLYIDTQTVKLFSFDVSSFFGESFGFHHVPAWAPKAPRRVQFWTDVVEAAAASGGTRGWWWSGDELGRCLEEVVWRLREGGWKEEEVREMMMMDGCDDDDDEEGENTESGSLLNENGVEDVAWRVRLMSVVLLRGGWSREDVVYSLGVQDQNECVCGKVVKPYTENEQEKPYMEFQLCN